MAPQEEQVKKLPVEFRVRAEELNSKVHVSRAEEPSYDFPPPDGCGPASLASLGGFGDCKVNPIPARKIDEDLWILKKKTQIVFAEKAAKYLRPVPTSIEGDGRSILQVFSVRIKRKICVSNHKKRITPVDVYGTIEVHDVFRFIPFYLYDQRQGEFKSISPYDTLCLAGTLCCCPENFMSVIFNLEDKDGDLFPGKSNSQSVDWNTRSGEYDTPICQRFDSKLCSATMRFIVFSDAVQAKVMVEVVEKDGKKDRNDRVYGSVVARYSKDYYYPGEEEMKYWQNVLFYCPENSYVKVNRWKSIPLSTPKVAVPTDSCLVIEAELWDYDKLVFDGGEIATGTVEFWPRWEGEAVHEIHGDNGLLRVTVAWCLGG